MARRMVCEWGMSEEMGPLTFGKKEEQIFLGRDISQQQDYSEDSAIRIDQEVKRIVTGNYERAREALSTHKEELTHIAEELLIREVLDAEQVKRIAKGLALEEPVPTKPTKPPPGGETDRSEDDRLGRGRPHRSVARQGHSAGIALQPRARYTLRLPGGRPLAIWATARWSWASSTSRRIPLPTAESILDPDRAADAALAMEQDGADIIDLGGESTRPGAAEVAADAEAARIVPVLQRLAPRLRVPISVDTYKAEVARQALDSGAGLVNDISGLRYDSDLAPVVASAGAPLVLMHMRGRSRDMYRRAVYGDVAGEVAAELAAALQRAEAAGIRRGQVILDPGLGFAKRADQTFAVLARLAALAALDRPLLVGPSRKSFLQEALGECPPGEREWGTAAAVTAAVLLGAHIVRVHGVRAMAQVVRVADRLRAEAPAAVARPAGAAAD